MSCESPSTNLEFSFFFLIQGRNDEGLVVLINVGEIESFTLIIVMEIAVLIMCMVIK